MLINLDLRAVPGISFLLGYQTIIWGVSMLLCCGMFAPQNCGSPPTFSCALKHCAFFSLSLVGYFYIAWGLLDAVMGFKRADITYKGEQYLAFVNHNTTPQSLREKFNIPNSARARIQYSTLSSDYPICYSCEYFGHVDIAFLLSDEKD